MGTFAFMKGGAYMTKIRNLLLQFVLFAMSGWIYEVLYTLGAWGEYENRGVLFGPWLPLYGFGGMIIYALFGKLTGKPVRIARLNFRIVPIFFYTCIFATLIELGATYLLDAIGMDFRILWDYSERFMNFEGRVSLSASLWFGALCVAILYLVMPLYRRFVGLRNQKLVHAVAWPIIVLFLIDAAARIPLGSNYVG